MADSQDSRTGRQSPSIEAFKEFAATSFAVEHRTSIIVLLVIIGVMGSLAYRSTPKESFPEIAVPILAINLYTQACLQPMWKAKSLGSSKKTSRP